MNYLKSVIYGLLLSSTIDCGVDASLRGAKDRNERGLQSSSGSVSHVTFPSLQCRSCIRLISSAYEQSRNVYCGAWNNRRCTDPETGDQENVLTVGMAETRPVRCCINTQLATGWKGCKNIENVYADSFPMMDFTAAKDFCENHETYSLHGGRLCSPGEIQDRCGTGSGLNYNKEHVWACIADGGTCEQNDAAACCTGFCNKSNVCEVGGHSSFFQCDS